MNLSIGHFRTLLFTLPVPVFGLTAVLIGTLALFIHYRYAEPDPVAGVQAELAGDWKGRQAISVRLKQNWKRHSFVSAGPVETRITIHPDGAVSGTAGDAEFAGCRVLNSRGHILRLLQLGTDFEIKGWLAGPVFSGDTIKMKPISIPFNLQNSRISGTLFHLQKGGLYPMAGDFVLLRTGSAN